MNNSISKSFYHIAGSLVFALYLSLILSAQLVSAQSDKISQGTESESKSNISFSMPTALESGKVILEKKIDPKIYELGPGDVLSIFTWGNFQGQYRLAVSPEGRLLIPEIGPVDVAGLTLEKAGGRITSSILKRYRNVEAVVSLADLRTFKVFVGGAVISPGAYPATAASRVSELIDMAGGFIGSDDIDKLDNTILAGGTKDEIKSSKRNVLIYRQDEDTLKADILRFEITGGESNNPTLLDGDRIFVPIRESISNTYGIFGAVRNPGYFEYSPDDSLSDLMALALGLTSSVDSGQVSVVRFLADGKRTTEIDLSLKSDNWNIPLKSDDRVYIKANSGYHEKYQVELKGEFLYPGFYAIREDSTRLSEIIEKAGGLTEAASLDEAEMTRVSAEEIVDPEYERLKKMQVADMTQSEYDYFKTKSRSKPGRVAVNFRALLVRKDSTSDIILRDGDVINVPRKSKVVSVIGEVANPGIMAYIPNADYRYYLKEAGGYSDRASKRNVTLIKGITSEWKKPKKGKPLEPGDTVWVPEKKRRDYWGFIKDTLVFVGNLATVYLVIQQATK